MGILKYFTIAFTVLSQVIALFYEKAKLSLKGCFVHNG